MGITEDTKLEQATNAQSSSGRQIVNTMFNVEIPPPCTAKIKASQKHLAQSEHCPLPIEQSMMSGRFDAPTPNPCLTARLSLIYLNSVTLQCIGLAMCVALFSKLLKIALQMASYADRQPCTVLPKDVLSIVAHRALNQTYSGVNATFWNMRQTAIFGLQSSFKCYEGAAMAACQAQNVVASNATSSMAQWISNMISNATNTTKGALGPLRDVKQTSEGGENSKGTTTVASLLNLEIPAIAAGRDCEGWLAQHLPNTTTLVATQQVQAILRDAQGSLASIMNEQIPLAQWPLCGNAKRLNSNPGLVLGKPTRIWEVIFSVGAVVAVVAAGYKEHSCWHYHQACANEVMGKQHSNILEKVNARIHHGGEIMSDYISNYFIHSSNHTLTVWMRWALNYSLASRLSRLLQMGVFLAFLAIANSTLISSVSSLFESPTEQSTTSCLAPPYSAFEGELNRALLNLILETIQRIEANHKKFVLFLQQTTSLDLRTMSPFASGVALEEVVLSPEIQQQHFSCSQSSTAAKDVRDLLKTINSAVWISSLTMFAMWAFFASCACCWAAYKVRKDGYNNYKKNSTSTSRS